MSRNLNTTTHEGNARTKVIFKYSELKLSAEIEWEGSHCGGHFYI